MGTEPDRQRRFYGREGHLTVPRKHVEIVPAEEGERAAVGRENNAARVGPKNDTETSTRPGLESVPVALGMFLANTRRRAQKLTEQRRPDPRGGPITRGASDATTLR